jgi:hypothetical protein
VKLIHYGTDGDITVNDHTYRFCDFLKLEAHYSAPYGFPTRVYERGVRHFITNGHTMVHLPLIDPECDRICNREGELARLVAMLRADE